MFTLTEEQINYIIEFYGSSKRIIKEIELKLNQLGIIEDEDDYYEIVATVAAQKETIREQLNGCTTKDQVMRIWVSTDKLILFALKEKYNDFSNFNPQVQEKMKSFH